ncbi:16S rRNA (cytidine(1402)-2'-O)-methyltransferase [Desulfobulbus alkaliphilus]|uniref:16S rRNA (cytidine(1402)-2'-O)-methyltransferase n=1 Tax=Desulfobulbus alkaliphilus TaxID=869814 RepID=UPI0019628188|nr:16S rRNA (cytidine(1402)-2'-O)-methyltransferase [Desulfobulbus alkaliphilus]MBM9536461.1 16S rRNA (cytidine(1402)-2'-O)-methyltransferase [Desulfobulbus alkaliphilus]
MKKIFLPSAQNTKPAKKGTLFVVGTPIGNLGDLTRRAIETLASVHLIACEDTRHTKKLCLHLGLKTPLISYYRGKEQEKSDILVQMLCAGKDVALVSDAGTPALSDPGAILVRKARLAGIEIVAVAGPSALTAAISIAGLPLTQFFFAGFPPANKQEKKRLFDSVSTLPYPLVFYEAPHRINTTLSTMIECFGDRQAVLLRELTKIHEECIEGTLSTLSSHLQKGVKGELVLIVFAAEGAFVDKPENLDELLCWYRDTQQTSLKDAVQSIASNLRLPRTEVYKKALSIWKERD